MFPASVPVRAAATGADAPKVTTAGASDPAISAAKDD